MPSPPPPLASAGHELRSSLIQLARAATLIALIVVGGVVGFTILGAPEYGVGDAIYMTVVTLTTVGYHEVIPLHDRPGGRAFTTILLVGGVGSFVYFFSNLTAFMVDGHFDIVMRQRKVRSMLHRLVDHYIVCGAGTTGEHLVRELLETHRPFAVVEALPERIALLEERLGQTLPSVIGDATDDEVLRAAGIERARGLTACISSDKDNLLVTVSARLLNPGLRIVVRCTEDRLRDKIVRSGADAVVSPNMIGGLRMVSEMIRPTVVSFLDIMLRDRQRGLRVEEFLVDPAHPLAGSTVGALRARALPDFLLVALKKDAHDWRFNPPDDALIEAGVALIYMGDPMVRDRLETLD